MSHLNKAFIAILCLCIQISMVSASIVAVSQITSHQALDNVLRGTIDALDQAGYSGEIITTNAHGDLPTAVQIAKRFTAKKPDVIVAISTPSAQTMLKATKKAIPIVFATVTDPVSAKLLTDLEHPPQNITGTRNKSPIHRQLSQLQKSLPNAKTIGIPLNYAEQNSVDLLNEAIEYAKTHNLTILPSSIASSSDIKAAASYLAANADAVFLLLDNTVASALPTLLSTCKQHKVPVFSTYLEAVAQGATMGLAYDEYSIGLQTGRIVYRILQGESPSDIPVEDPEKILFAVNKQALSDLNIPLPVDEIDQYY